MKNKRVNLNVLKLLAGIYMSARLPPSSNSDKDSRRPELVEELRFTAELKRERRLLRNRIQNPNHKGN